MLLSLCNSLGNASQPQAVSPSGLLQPGDTTGTTGRMNYWGRFIRVIHGRVSGCIFCAFMPWLQWWNHVCQSTHISIIFMSLKHPNGLLVTWRMASSGMLCRVALVRTTDARCEEILFLRGVRWLPATASVVPSSPILVTLMNEALSSSETSVLTRATRRNIPEDAILLVTWYR
jgi:hypothetical protein